MKTITLSKKETIHLITLLENDILTLEADDNDGMLKEYIELSKTIENKLTQDESE